MDFNFNNESIKPSTGVLTVDSTGAIVIPWGTTAQRPASPVTGALRFNSETKQTEIYNGTSWVSSNAQIFNRVVVQKNPGAGQFSSIAAACASITTNTVDNPVEIAVFPGVYLEPVINVPDYVQISGSDQYSVIIKPATSTQNLFVMGSGTSVNFLQIEDVGTGYAAITVKDLTDGYALFHKVSIINSDTGWDIGATTDATTVYLEYCDTTDGTYGVKVSSANNIECRVNLENFYVYGEAQNPDFGIDITGTSTHVDMQAFGLEGIDDTGVGARINNGAFVNIKAGDVDHWATGILIGDSGTPSTVNILAVSLYENSTLDLQSLNSGTLGTFSGSARRAFVDTSASPNFTLTFSDPVENAFIQTGRLFMGPTSVALTDVTELTIDTPPLGLVSGGAVTISSGRTMAVAAGIGYFRRDDVVTRVEWDAGTITIAAGALAYIYINNSGVISQSLSRPDPLTNIILSRVLAGASTIVTYGNASLDIRHYGNQVDQYLRDAVGVLYASGSVVTENTTTARALDVTAGYWLFSTQTNLPSGGTPITFLDVYKVSGVTTLAPATQVDNTTYISGGDLVSLTSGYYAKHTLYTNGEGAGERYFLQHADAQYATLQEAVDAPLATPLIDPTGVPKIAAIIVQQGNSNLVQIIDVRPRIGGSSTGTSGVSDHGELTGLADDDHTQYLLVNGTRAMSGPLDLATNNITNAGTINGITITAHGSRHLPNGADPITTASAVSLSNSTTNTTGIANSLARSDHTHAITGFQPQDATLTALAAYNTNGLLTQTAADTFTGRTLTGTTNRVTVTNGNGVAGNPTVDIASTYVGQATITTLGTIATGTWNATAISAARGGTGLTSIGTANQILGVNTGATALEYKTVTAGTAIGISNAAGSITINNTGVTSLTAGSGIGISASTGSVTISNTGGTVSSVDVSGGTTGLTTTGGPVTSSGTITLTGTLATSNGGTGLTTAGTANQILGMNTGATALEYKTVTAGTGITVTPAAGSLTIVNSGVTSLTAGSGINISASTGAVTVSAINSGTVTSVSGSGGTTGLTLTGGPITSSGTLTLGGTLIAANGGTGQTSYAVGDLLFANTTTTLAKLAGVATGNSLISGGTNTAPSWGKIGLTTHVSGTLPVANGGTNLTSIGTANQILGVNTGATALEYKTVTAGTGISVTPSAGTLTVANTGVTSFSGASTGLTPNTATTGAVTLGGTLLATHGGTGLTSIGTSNQLLGVNAAGTGLEYKTLTAGTGITITPGVGSATITAVNNGTVTSVGLSMPSIFTVTGSPVTSSGTLTASLNTVPSNTMFAGSATSGQTIAPAFRTIGLAQGDINDVTVTSAIAGETLIYNGTRWVNEFTEVIQVVGGAITATSSNAQIPYDATTPVSTEGVQLWTRAFTPKSDNSVIVVLTHMFYTVNSAADVYVSGATFSGTTCVAAGLLGFTTNTGNGNNAVQEAVITNTSTAARTISFRAGPNSNVTTFYGQGVAGQTYGGVQTGGYMIFEINNAN